MRLLRHCFGLALVGPLVALTVALPSPSVNSPPFDTGTPARSVDLRDAPGAVPYEDGWAIPLVGARPDWFSQDIEQQVLSSGGQPVLAPEDAPLPGTVGIRPGSWMVAPAGCTMNFVFSRDDGALAIGTAGHCVEEEGQPVVLLTLAPGSGDPVLVDIGTVILRRDNGIGDDFALVSIRPELSSWVSSTTAIIGGPCGQYTGSGPETVAHYGHGLAIGTGGTPRFGVALTWKEDSFGWDSPAIFGDSGSPVRITTLGAAGNLTHLVVSDEWLPSLVAGTRIGKILEIAEEEMAEEEISEDWSLVNSPLCVLGLTRGTAATGWVLP